MRKMTSQTNLKRCRSPMMRSQPTLSRRRKKRRRMKELLLIRGRVHLLQSIRRLLQGTKRQHQVPHHSRDPTDHHVRSKETTAAQDEEVNLPKVQLKSLVNLADNHQTQGMRVQCRNVKIIHHYHRLMRLKCPRLSRSSEHGQSKSWQQVKNSVLPLSIQLSTCSGSISSGG